MDNCRDLQPLRSAAKIQNLVTLLLILVVNIVSNGTIDMRTVTIRSMVRRCWRRPLRLTADNVDTSSNSIWPSTSSMDTLSMRYNGATEPSPSPSLRRVCFPVQTDNMSRLRLTIYDIKSNCCTEVVPSDTHLSFVILITNKQTNHDENMTSLTEIVPGHTAIFNESFVYSCVTSCVYIRVSKTRHFAQTRVLLGFWNASSGFQIHAVAQKNVTESLFDFQLNNTEANQLGPNQQYC